MKKLGSYIRKAVLFGLIGLFGTIGCVKSGDVASASVASGSLITTEAVTGQAISAETDLGRNTLYPISVQTEGEIRYGYIDITGKMIIKPTYMSATNFSEGLAIVNNGEKSQIINEKGKIIFESEGFIGNFHNGLAAYSDPSLNYKQGYINTKGKVVIKPQFNFAGDFNTDHTALVIQSEKYCLINNKGKVLKTYQLSKKYNTYSITKDGYIIITDKTTYLRGVVKLDGKVILKPIYGEVTYLGSGLFGVKKALPDYESYLVNIKPAALFNQEGKQITSYKYYDLSEFTGDYASATDSKYTYFIDKQGNKVTSLPVVEGIGNMTFLGDIIQGNIDYEMVYMKKDGTFIWKKDDITNLSSGITVSTIKMRPNKYVLVNYPKVDGINNAEVENTINKKLLTLFTKYRKNLKEKDNLFVDDSFTVKQMEDLLIINKTGYDYPVGAAHGTPLCNYYFINVKTGDFYELKDLFKNDSDYVSKLSKIILKRMNQDTKNGDAVYFIDSKFKINKNQYFYLSQDKLTIFFDSGAVTAYAAGFPKFEIPFKDIQSIINTEGSFWKAFHE